MTSTAQLEANRCNALRSTGPRTEAGKARSAVNPTRHGLTSRLDVTIRGGPFAEDDAAIQSFIGQVVADLAPVTEQERVEAGRVAGGCSCSTRCSRQPRFCSPAPSPGDALVSTTSFNAATGTYTLSVKDLTQSGAGVTEKIRCADTCQNTSAEVISEAPGGGPPNYGLSDFGAESYTGITVATQGSGYGGLSGPTWSHDPIDMVDGSGNQLAVPGPAEGGKAFTDRWLNPP